MMLQAFAINRPPLEISVLTVRSLLERFPRRIAFAGKAGAGKSTMAAQLAGATWPIFNHADPMKEEVLAWVAQARTRGLIPTEEATFVDFCNYLGISPGIVKADMWPVLGEVWDAFSELLQQVYNAKTPVQRFVGLAQGEALTVKVDFVDQYKALFRTPCQRYGQAIKDISANPAYWAEQTLERGLPERICFNADTRFVDEAETLKSAGWTTVYLWIDEATQVKRRPDLTPEQKAHPSENGISPHDCDLHLDGTQSIAKVMLDLADRLTARTVKV